MKVVAKRVSLVCCVEWLINWLKFTIKTRIYDANDASLTYRQNKYIQQNQGADHAMLIKSHHQCLTCWNLCWIFDIRESAKSTTKYNRIQMSGWLQNLIDGENCDKRSPFPPGNGLTETGIDRWSLIVCMRRINAIKDATFWSHFSFANQEHSADDAIPNQFGECALFPEVTHGTGWPGMLNCCIGFIH